MSHDAFDVLENDDRIVDDDADGQHQPEQRQKIDRKAEGIHAGKRADDRDRHRQNRNKSRAPVLQEDEDDDDDQHHRLNEGFDNFFDRNAHETRRVEGNCIVYACRKGFLQLRHPGLNGVVRAQRIGPWLQVNADWHGGRAVMRGIEGIVLRTEFKTGNVLEAQRPGVLVRSDDNLFKGLRIRKAAFGVHRISESQIILHRFFAETAGGELRILLANGSGHITWGQIVLRQLVRPQPDTHGIVLGTEERGVTDTGHSLELVDNIEQRIIADKDGIVTLIRCRHGHERQNGA